MRKGIVILAIVVTFSVGFNWAFGKFTAWEKADRQRAETITQKTETIVRVFMHGTGRYSYLTRSVDSPKLIPSNSYNWQDNVQLIADVPVGQDMHAIHFTNGNGVLVKIEIHVHSPQDVNGAGWDAGKQGQGMTTVVN